MDIFLAGHVHAYERTSLVYGGEVDDCGITHFALGKIEFVSSFFIELVKLEFTLIVIATVVLSSYPAILFLCSNPFR